MNNRWIYGLELIVFGWIAARGGWIAVRGLSLLGRVTGVLALMFAAASAMLFGLFVLNRPIRPLLHVTPFIGVALVFVGEYARAARTVPGWTAPFVGLYSTLSLIVAKSRHAVDPAEANETEDAEP
jgi:hypothetical protein